MNFIIHVQILYEDLRRLRSPFLPRKRSETLLRVPGSMPQHTDVTCDDEVTFINAVVIIIVLVAVLVSIHVVALVIAIIIGGIKIAQSNK